MDKQDIGILLAILGLIVTVLLYVAGSPYERNATAPAGPTVTVTTVVAEHGPRP